MNLRSAKIISYSIITVASLLQAIDVVRLLHAPSAIICMDIVNNILIIFTSTMNLFSFNRISKIQVELEEGHQLCEQVMSETEKLRLQTEEIRRTGIFPVGVYQDRTH